MGLSQFRLLAGRPNVMIMSATLTDENCAELKKLSGLRSNIVTIRLSPVLACTKYISFERPAIQKGSGIGGYVDQATGKTVIKVEEGLLSSVLKCFLEDWCQDIENEIEPKMAMIFSENMTDLTSVQTYLFNRLGDKGTKKPWLLVNSKTGAATKRRMRREIKMPVHVKLFLSSSVLMQGTDFHRADIVLLCRPYPFLHSLLQAAGGGGRKLHDGRRRRVAVIQLWNAEDLGRPGLDGATKKYCQAFSCLRAELKQFFNDVGEEKIDGWCCSNCD